MPVEVEASLQAVVQEATLQTHIVLGGCLPLDGAVLNVLEEETYSVVSHLHALPIGTGCVVVEVVVTTLIHTGCQLQVVDTL